MGIKKLFCFTQSKKSPCDAVDFKIPQRGCFKQKNDEKNFVKRVHKFGRNIEIKPEVIRQKQSKKGK